MFIALFCRCLPLYHFESRVILGIGFTIRFFAYFAYLLRMQKTQTMTKPCFFCVFCVYTLRYTQIRKQSRRKAARFKRARVYPCDAVLVVCMDNLGWCFFEGNAHGV